MLFVINPSGKWWSFVSHFSSSIIVPALLSVWGSMVKCVPGAVEALICCSFANLNREHKTSLSIHLEMDTVASRCASLKRLGEFPAKGIKNTERTSVNRM